LKPKQTEETAKVMSKSFMTAGPTLHYSHKGVISFWLFVVFVFGIACLFWSKIMTGDIKIFDIGLLSSPDKWGLGQYVVGGISIFEYPWQIIVLGYLMAIFAMTPLLISQLMSFRYSLPLILSVGLLADLPGLAISLVISCIAVACRPLRFRSRFIAIALCTAPQLFYWGCFGSTRGFNPINWGFSYAPWICAWIVALAMAGIVLIVGHFLRYRPGVIAVVTALTVLQAFFIFDTKIGFDELDYQLYVAKNNPENFEEFRDYNITEVLDNTINNPTPQVSRYLKGFFFPRDQIELRKKLKEEILSELQVHDRWPWWFNVPDRVKYQQKRADLLEDYELFINRRPGSSRMPIALYYKAILNEYSPDFNVLKQNEQLQFYNDYPNQGSESLWRQLYTEFGESPESLEARWRIARHYASQGFFDQAEQFVNEAQQMLTKLLSSKEESSKQDDIFSDFRPPAVTVMTKYKLIELQRKLNKFSVLISKENRNDDRGTWDRLAKFLSLNPHSLSYEENIDKLLSQMDEKDPLIDNVLLAMTKLIPDAQLRAEKLRELHEKFRSTDGGIEALYTLGILKKEFWLEQEGLDLELKKKYLAETRETLMNFIKLYPASIFAEQVQKNLEVLPASD
jgi:hypothetical protein